MVSVRDDPDKPGHRPGPKMGQAGLSKSGGLPKLGNSCGLPEGLLTGNILFLQETVSAKEFTN